MTKRDTEGSAADAPCSTEEGMTREMQWQRYCRRTLAASSTRTAKPRSGSLKQPDETCRTTRLAWRMRDHLTDVKNVEHLEKKKVSFVGGIENARGSNASTHRSYSRAEGRM